jgi:pimeloyl-ACP methyl ester carboxylesterase
MSLRILGAILRKDVQSLKPIVALTTLLFLADPIIVRLELLPVWTMYSMPVVLVALLVLVLSVFQLDSPAGLDDDWLCRPIPKGALLTAKFTLVCSAVYLPRAIGTLVADLIRGFPLAEALLDALLLQDKPSLFLLPIFLFIAVVTRTFVQGFGVLFAIFICVFVLPTPFVREPGPLDPGIREGLGHAGLEWLGSLPAKLASYALVACGFWLIYWRRRLGTARVMLAVTVCAALFFMLLPTALMPWNTTFALQRASAPAPTADADPARIYLHHPRLCFPATRRGELKTDPAFVAAARGSESVLWEVDVADALRDVGPESVAFLTNIEARNLPLDWRVKLSYVRAEYSVNGATRYSLRPARYITDQNGGGSLAHAWMLPEGAVRELRDAKPQLELEYSLTLLRPHEYRVPTDGKRHVLPGLGYCGAKVDEPGNRIEVDCFSAFNHPAQISAELNEVPASRVYGRVDLAPAYAQWPYGKRVALTIGSPRLAKHDSITVTAWQVASQFQKSLSFPGILGAELDTCPLPTSAGDGFQKANWRDAAPHETHSVRVDEGVQLEVLDFGGERSPVLLLPGLGATAHSYDELAPRLAAKHRVVAITRRGTGDSSKPGFGFDTARLAQDVLQVMDDMRLEKALLVGHSIAGDELTWLGGNHPDRFSGLVYLDAAYDRSADPKAPAVVRLRELNRALPPEPPRPPQALLNYAAMTKMLLERGHVPIPEGELIAFWRMSDPYFPGVPNIDARTQQAISAAIQPPDYARVKLPALAIYARPDPDRPLPPWYDANDAALAATLAEIRDISEAIRRESMEQFRRGVASGQVLEMPNAHHYMIQSNQREVLEAIEKFAATLNW